MKAFDQQTLNNPITDIIDSYYIMRHLKIALVTTFNKRLYDYYAHRFIESYN